MASWDTHATIVKYALDNGTVNDEIIEAVLAMTALCDFAGAEKEPPTLDQMLLLQVRRLSTMPGLSVVHRIMCALIPMGRRSTSLFYSLPLGIIAPAPVLIDVPLPPLHC
jgi:hypothetical protein